MKQYSYLLNTHTAFSVMIGALFLIYIITVGSITSASFSLERLGAKRENLIERNLQLSQVLGSKQSLEYLEEASQPLGLEEIRRAVYLELQESGTVVRR